MARRGDEGSHRLDGLTVSGGFEAGQISYGPNGTGGVALPNVLAPMIAPNLVGTSATAWTANAARGYRFIAPRDCTLVDIAIFVGTASGVSDLGVYDCAATSRTRLFSTGSFTNVINSWNTASGTAGVTPSLSLFKGQVFDVAHAADNATVTVQQTAVGSSAVVAAPSAAWLPTFTDAAGLVAGTTTGRWGWVATTSFPLPNPLLESGMGNVSSITALLVRIV